MKPFFTIPDPDLTQESSVDPMGLLIIWTSLGQEIFGEKLTTIANDLRVFTFNLFHHHFINRLFLEYTEEVQQAKARYGDWNTEFDMKAGLVIFLEDLATHIFFLSQDGTAMDKMGILGMSKARMLHHLAALDQIMLAATKRKGLLKNQLNLGMTGRYKGPMMNMEFFDRTFSYIPASWEPVDRMIKKWTAAHELEEQLFKLVIRQLFASENKSYPQLSLGQLKQSRSWTSLVEGYKACLGSRKLPKQIRDYWKDRLGLQSGASAALYQEMSTLRERDAIDHANLFRRTSKRLEKEPDELLKITRVLEVEPFLSHAEYLLRYVAQPSTANLKDEETKIEELRKEIQRSGRSLPADLPPRFRKLQHAALLPGTTGEWLRAMLNYHQEVMTERGGTPWVGLDDRGIFKHNFSPQLGESLHTVKKYLNERPWFHTYYMETVRSIYRSIEL